jgi:hypothetical protein
VTLVTLADQYRSDFPFKKLDASFIGAPQRGKRPMRGQQRYQIAFHQLQYSSIPPQFKQLDFIRDDNYG